MAEGRATALAVLPSTDLAADLAHFTTALGFRLERILPADDPRVAELSGHGLRLRLERAAPGAAPGTLCLRGATQTVGATRSPGGTRILHERADTDVVLPPTRHRLEVRRLADGAPWVIGRAGMHYRDLIPSRLGGSVIASHIRIPDGGPVPDMVHYHAVGFQLIHCVRGRVRLVYEDQGEPFWLEAGDSVTQPPRIRHRVLEASAGLEVVELGVPAEHVTLIDHDMTLPTGRHDPAREFEGQRFCRARRCASRWTAHAVAGFERRDTGVAVTSGGVADVAVVRPARLADVTADALADGTASAPPANVSSANAPTGAGTGVRVRHDADILFAFVLGGTLALDGRALVAGDAFTLPPGRGFTLAPRSADLEWLEVSLPGNVAGLVAD